MDGIDKVLQTMWKAEEKSETYQGLFNESSTIEELLTTLHNEPELQVEEPDCIIGYNMVTREKFNQWLKEIGYEAEINITQQLSR